MTTETEQIRYQNDIRQRTGFIELSSVYKTYELPAGQLHAVNDVSLSVQKGEFLAIVGQSGSGKTTLVNLLTGIDVPSSGTVRIGEYRIEEMKQKELTAWRGRNVGVVFQFFQLLPTLSVVENVMLPMEFCRMYDPGERRDRAVKLLEDVGIADQADKLPAFLSGGQQQRAAIARALANDPSIICADEPTGNLDSKTSDAVLGLFLDLSNRGKTVLMVTHERDISSHASRFITLRDGEIADDRRTQ